MNKDNTYAQHILEKGYTLQECNKPITTTLEYAQSLGYDSVEEYHKDLHDFLNEQ